MNIVQQYEAGEMTRLSQGRTVPEFQARRHRARRA